MSQVTLYTNLSLDDISYTKPVNQNNLYFGSMSYQSNPLLIQSAKLHFKCIQEDPSKQKYLFATVDPKDFSFYDSLLQLDDHNLSETYKNSKEWFQKDLPMDILESMYRRITQPFTKGTIPEIKLKVPFYKEKLQSKVYNSDNELMNYQDIKPGDTLLCIVQVKGLKFLKQEYYCDMCIQQIKVCASPKIATDRCLIVDEEDTPSPEFDYEILDEEVIERQKQILQLQSQIEESESKLAQQQSHLDSLKTQLKNLA